MFAGVWVVGRSPVGVSITSSGGLGAEPLVESVLAAGGPSAQSSTFPPVKSG